MYFINSEHEENFQSLLVSYPIGQIDRQYQAGFYVVAIPTIFDRCEGNPVCSGHGPFDWYFDEESNLGLNAAGLSGGYQCLVKAALNLYNDHQDFSLYLSVGTWGNELFQVFVEACQIRRGKYI